MVYRTFSVVAALVLSLGRVIADWDANPEGVTGSGIKTVDTDEGFNVIDSGGAFFFRLKSVPCSLHSHFSPLIPGVGCIRCTFQYTEYTAYHVGNFSVLTSYKYNKCSSDQMKALKQAVSDANVIAYAGIKVLARPGAGPVDWIDFGHEAAIDYFGPPSKNSDQQSKIFSKSLFKGEQVLQHYQAYAYATSHFNSGFLCLPWMGLERLVE